MDAKVIYQLVMEDEASSFSQSSEFGWNLTAEAVQELVRLNPDGKFVLIRRA